MYHPAKATPPNPLEALPWLKTANSVNVPTRADQNTRVAGNLYLPCPKLSPINRNIVGSGREVGTGGKNIVFHGANPPSQPHQNFRHRLAHPGLCYPPPMITTKTNAKLYAKEMRRLKRQVPYVIAKTLNDVAFEGRKTVWPSITRKEMTIRTKWTANSMRVTRASVASLTAVLGSVAPYMATQETGATEGKKGQHGVPIPAASPATRKSRKRPTPASLRLGGISLLKSKSSGKSKAQKMAVAINEAKRKGGKQFVFLELSSGRKGIFQVGGRPKLKKVWDLSKTSVTIPPTKTLWTASFTVLKQRIPPTYTKRFAVEVVTGQARMAQKMER